MPIDYGGETGPAISIRVQELFGLDRHPSVCNGKIPLTLELLSPAQRPIQITRDLPGFWAGSWADVKAEMKGRYPKHPWPDDPTSAEATRRAKPREAEERFFAAFTFVIPDRVARKRHHEIWNPADRASDSEHRFQSRVGRAHARLISGFQISVRLRLTCLE